MEEGREVVRELKALLPGRVRPAEDYRPAWWALAALDPSARGEALAAVVPRTVEEVAAVVRFAYERGIPINVYGGGSSVTGAAAPRGGIVLDLRGLDRLREVDPDGFAVAEAGMALADLEARLNGAGFTLGQFPQSMDLATLGGYISTLGSGHGSSGYGNVEDVVSRLEAVVPPGEVLWTGERRVPRTSMGPDLARLFLGAEGAFGVVTAAELRLRRLPRARWRESALFPTFEEGFEALRRLAEADIPPAVARLHDELETAYYLGQRGAVLLLEYHLASETLLGPLRGLVAEAVGRPFAGPQNVERYMAERFSYREHAERIRAMGLAVETAELAAAWSRLPGLHRAVRDALASVDGVALASAHVSHIYRHGACIYYTVLFRPEAEVYRAIWTALAEAAEAAGATLSHHHGVGLVKLPYLPRERPAHLLARLKRALDPKGLLNPGRLTP